MIQRILDFRAGMAVKRYHTVNMHIDETVGHHSCNVTWIVLNLTHSPSPALIKAALLHDVAEQWTGDVPATAKWESEDLKVILNQIESKRQYQANLATPDLTMWEHKILKQADMLDLCFKMVEEIRMGNTNCIPILMRGLTYLEENDPLPETVSIIHQLEEVCQKQINTK